MRTVIERKKNGGDRTAATRKGTGFCLKNVFYESIGIIVMVYFIITKISVTRLTFRLNIKGYMTFIYFCCQNSIVILNTLKTSVESTWVIQCLLLNDYDFFHGCLIARV